jgi:uridine phosphorylase
MQLANNKFYSETSVFKAENLLREARRQKHLESCDIPSICLLDPDGDILSYLIKSGQAELNKCWACYHTQLYTFKINALDVGIIGYVVGSSFAVLVAEQAFASGCQYLLSITSSGVITPRQDNVQYLLIDEAVRDEGTSYHYLPADESARLNPELKNIFSKVLIPKNKTVAIGKSWTTDAPYRETSSAISAMQKDGVQVVEMEAAALYAFAQANNKVVICLAHITNTMAQSGNDFEKGAENGSRSSIDLVSSILSLLPIQKN